MPVLLSRAGANIPAEVQRWQYFLRVKAGIATVGEIDADFGPLTESATKSFQQKMGLPQSGALDAATHSAAVQIGYRDLNATFYTDRESTNWPPRPNFSSPENPQRNAALSCFNFRLEPLNGPGGQRRTPDREGIRILGSCDGTSADWIAENIVTIELTQLAHVSGYSGRVRCHKLVAPKVTALFAAWEQEDLLHLFLTWDGMFVPRYKRGLADSVVLPAGHGSKRSADVSELSNHAFGSAFDINQKWNPFKRPPPHPATVPEKGSVRLLVPTANAHGFYWGGHYGNKKDGMHFELAKFD